VLLGSDEKRLPKQLHHNVVLDPSPTPLCKKSNGSDGIMCIASATVPGSRMQGKMRNGMEGSTPAQGRLHIFEDECGFSKSPARMAHRSLL
jgi:hypothetical protein